MTQDDFLQREISSGAVSQRLHLMLRHRLVRLVLDAGNLAPIFQRADHSPEIDDRAGR